VVTNPSVTTQAGPATTLDGHPRPMITKCRCRTRQENGVHPFRRAQPPTDESGEPLFGRFRDWLENCTDPPNGPWAVQEATVATVPEQE
jgi:hypothetical protein